MAETRERATITSVHTQSRRSMAVGMEEDNNGFPTPSRHGSLHVKGFLNRWRRLTVELENHQLTISVIRRGVIKRVFRLTAETVCEDNNIRTFCFCLSNGKDEKIYFAADDISSKEAWIDSIQSSLSLLRINQRKLQGKERRKVHVNEVSQYLNRPMIYVKVIRGRNLAANDIGYLSDPYVKVNLGGSSVRTITRTKELNPDWGMVFPFDWDASMRFIHLEVWDEDYSNPDDFMGSAYIPVIPLRDGDVLRQWYPLGKKTSRNIVSGEIEVELSCTGQPDQEQLAWQFFQEVQRLPEFSINLAASMDGLGQVAIRRGPFGPLITRAQSQQQPLSTTTNNDSNVTEVDTKLTGFPFCFPSMEHESLEDLAVNVCILSPLNTGKVSAPGVLMLTNKRILFVSLNRVLAQNDCVDDSAIDNNNTNPSMKVGNTDFQWQDEIGQRSFDEIDLSTEIPVNTVVNIQLTTDSEGYGGNSFDALRLKCSDGRMVTFLFKDDASTYSGATLSSLGACCLNKAIEQYFRGSESISSSASTSIKRRTTNTTVNVTPTVSCTNPSTVLPVNDDRLTSTDGASRKTRMIVTPTINERLTATSPLAIAWLRMVRGAPSSSTEAIDSIEGPPAHRMYTQLKFRSFNRSIERYAAVTSLYPLLHALRESCGLFTFPPPRSFVELIEGEDWASSDLIGEADDLASDIKAALEGNFQTECKEVTATTDEEFLLQAFDDSAKLAEEPHPATDLSTAINVRSGVTDEAVSAAPSPNLTQEPGSKTPTKTTTTAAVDVAVKSSPQSLMTTVESNSGKRKDKEALLEQRIALAQQKRKASTFMALAERVKASPDLTDAFTKLFFNFESNWHIYNPMGEFRRQGLPNAHWRISMINARYEICPTYPAILAVPASIDDDIIIRSSVFRSKNRFPTLSWVHRNGCSLSRCSQPLIGITNNRNEFDERLLSAINRCSQAQNTGGNSMGSTLLSSQPSLTSFSNAIDVLNAATAAVGTPSPPLKPYVIVDARPLLNAKANQAVGKGVESEKVYENVTVLFMDIANIHAVRKSLEMVEEAMQDESTWARNLEASCWLTYIRKILIAAGRIAHCINREKVSVLVHCSDGWDRTSQLTSLSMLLMDPYYRTLEGFIVLIEKEWFSFGHKFADRLGWGKDGWKDEEKSPIFVQFLDCVHQCLLQLPSAFEFNQQLLLFIMEHLHSGWFSNFLFNCERETKEFEPWKSSVSIWTAVLSNRLMFVNDGFHAVDGLITPVVSKTRLAFWSEWFLNWHDRIWTFNWIETHQIDSNKGNVTGNIVWIDDRQVHYCAKCARKFSFFLRKHHCRCCGNIFCDPCSRETRIIPAVSHWRQVRCCVDCAFSIDTSQYDDMSSEISTMASTAVDSYPSSRTPSVAHHKSSGVHLAFEE